jgi:hypothetical protein
VVVGSAVLEKSNQDALGGPTLTNFDVEIRGTDISSDHEDNEESSDDDHQLGEEEPEEEVLPELTKKVSRGGRVIKPSRMVGGLKPGKYSKK